jgi:hypothetical protein
MNSYGQAVEHLKGRTGAVPLRALAPLEVEKYRDIYESRRPSVRRQPLSAPDASPLTIWRSAMT